MHIKIELTPAEKQMLKLLSTGLTERDVALQMNKSVFTIDKYLRSVFLKYGHHTTTAVVAEALRRGDID